jgi:hypothetical protein
MKNPFPFFVLLVGCGNTMELSPIKATNISNRPAITSKKFEPGSWPYFLQHLPVVDSPVVDYRGKPIEYQEKSAGIIPYDVGRSDLQQCADALMRLRAEYLFGQHRYDQIGFHFTGRQYYSWNDYCKGIRPVPAGNDIKLVNRSADLKTHESLRKYLDIVYTYAGTISLAKELKDASDFEVGTVVIHPGSPGHCFIIIDEKTVDGKKLFKLGEGYTPAQSVYVVRNIYQKEKSPWYELKKGRIETASYSFDDYSLKKFE